MTSFVRIDPQAIAELFRSEHGPVMRYNALVATAVQTEAKARVGYDDKKQSGEPHLRDTIVKRFINVGGHASYWVGSLSPIARLHHDGTQAHSIDPVRAKVLVFESGGVTVYAAHVDHPGTKPNKFLEDAARALGLPVRRIT